MLVAWTFTPRMFAQLSAEFVIVLPSITYKLSRMVWEGKGTAFSRAATDESNTGFSP
jgi:hypothetical protein